MTKFSMLHQLSAESNKGLFYEILKVKRMHITLIIIEDVLNNTVNVGGSLVFVCSHLL